MAGLEVIQPTTGTVTLAGGRAVEVRPVTMGKLPAFMEAVAPLLGAIAGQPQDAGEMAMFAAFAQHAGSVNKALAIVTDLELTEIEALGIDDGLALVIEVFRVNRDLFQQRLLPMLGQALKAA